MRQHGIFRKTPRFRYTWFSRPARLFDPRPSTCQYNLEPGGLFDLGAKEYQRLHPNLTPICRSVQLPLLFLRISLRFRWPRRGRQAKWSAPDPGPRSSDDQFVYLACLPAQNIRPSHSPSTWARPAPPRRPGLVLTYRTSLARPIQPTRPVYMTHARSKISRRVCILRGSRTAGGPSRFETQGCAADGTADSPKLCRAATYNIMCE